MTAAPPPGMDALLGEGGSMGALMRHRCWQGTPLGPMAGWPQSLRSSVGICLSSRFPMIIFWGPELAQLYNDAYVPILGSKHPAALGQPAEECWREIWDVIGPMLRQVLDRGQATYSDDLLLITQRFGFREECYFTFSYSPVRDESGGVGGVFCAVTETTERVVGERRLAILRELGQQTLAATSAAEACADAAAVFARSLAEVPFALLYLLDAGGRTATLAGAAGLPPGHPLSPITVDLDGPACWPLAAALGGPQEVPCPAGFEPARLTRAGFDPPHTAMISPLLQAGAERPAGFLVAGVSSARPLDDDCRTFLGLAASHISAALANATAFEAERRRAEQLAELDRAKTMFFSNVSHEFRTPLTLMLGPAEDLLAAPLPDADRERVRTIHNNALRLLKLVNTLLAFSRSEAGAMPADLRPADLAGLTGELASLFQVAVERGGLALVVECAALSRPVLLDRDMWEKVILNLLSNAFKFTLEGEIRVRVEEAGDRARVTVTDTGVGIAAEELPRLFDRFHRVSGTRARSGEGSGIGLALTRELIHRHGGTIEVESTQGKGSTFTVLLPFAPDPVWESTAAGPDHGVQATAYVQEALGWTPSYPSSPGEPAPEVLIVDDNADMRTHLVRLLSPHWRVSAVGDGRAALRAVELAPPELVLTDVMMPGLDGFELLRALRADERTQTVPVIMVSARAGQEATIEGLSAGADDYLIKPFTAVELVARVGAHLRLSRQRNQVARRLRELTEITERLHASLDPAEIAGTVCEWLVPDYAAGCAIWLLDEGDEGGAGPSSGRGVPVPLARRGSVSGSGLDGPPAGLGEHRSPDRIAVPLRGPGDTAGVIVLDSPTPVADDAFEQGFLTALADRAALALENAAAYRNERRIALHLQRSLLPQKLPDVDGVELAARYVAGAAGQLVGGDWYDAIALPEGRLALVIGDVMGKGVEAAALMGRLRTAIHAYTLEGLLPAPLLERLNVFLDRDGTRQFTTLCYALLDPARRHLEIANAGHLPPLVVPASGRARLLEVFHGLALGVDPRYTYRSQSFSVPPNGTLLFYTDGLVENPEQLLGERLLELRLAVTGKDNGAESVCARVMRAMAPDGSDDDIAVLAVHVPARRSL
ncbi:SpoIIE family protein phosphatase [Nonomuraea sp. MTCD27]|uniref:SpoIIE family protein phosphatase n=1 Tax=Nonomuraea sp. MTCD27 TaxID=1676747 RepID=UPI0035BFA5CF